ncbi:MAG: hypothetical protein E7633_10450 [Ruminococcaceae bacterium]|nr:hypothetical protein [Oscillospiraceae bacterium]
MKQSIGLWQFVGFGVTSMGGTLLHFLYEWTGESIFVSLFSGVNESTWEHMKLLFVPMFIYAVLESLFFKDREDFWCIKARGIILGITLIPILFYTYNGVIGTSPDWINIAIFFISAAISYIYETKAFKKEEISCKSSKAAFILICTVAILFVIFTFFTPEIGIFEDPITGKYGIENI